MKSEARMIGKQGEWLAAQYLADRGYLIVQRNFRHLRGEIDLIAEKDGMIVFVEVKTRIKETYGEAVEAVTVEKQQKIIRTSLYYLHRLNKTDTFQVRFDVITIKLRGKTLAVEKIVHFKDAFTL